LSDDTTLPDRAERGRVIPVSAQPPMLLVNFWYAHPVGHAIEALRYCLGYHRADPTARICLVLNSATPTELAALCPFVGTTYPVSHPFFEAVACPDDPLGGVPRDWDWVPPPPVPHAAGTTLNARLY
jgi:hypothetical protein